MDDTKPQVIKEYSKVQEFKYMDTHTSLELLHTHNTRSVHC